MPVQKFRTLEEARRALWLPPGDARIARRMRHLARMAGPSRNVRRGVWRFRSIEEAKRQKGAAWQVRPGLDVPWAARSPLDTRNPRG